MTESPRTKGHPEPGALLVWNGLVTRVRRIADERRTTSPVRPTGKAHDDEQRAAEGAVPKPP